MQRPADQREPDPTALLAWRAQLAEARDNAWLASLLMRRMAEVRRLCAEYCRQLMALPRRQRRRLAKIWAMSIPAAALALALMSTPAEAATITVDGQDAGSGDCTLIDAIDSANADTNMGNCVATDLPFNGDTVVVGGGTYTYLTHDNGDNGRSALPTITSQITIEGNGSIIERGAAASSTFRLINVASTGTLTLNSATVRGGEVNQSGSGGQDGAGIRNAGTAVITNSTITGNSATRIDSAGGGIAGGRVTITDSTFSGNVAVRAGGAVAVYGSVSITNSTLSGNSGGLGGGVYHSAYSTLSITNSTLSGNTARAGNGGGIFSYNRRFTIRNSIITETVQGGDCEYGYFGLPPTGSNNLIDEYATGECSGVSSAAVTNFDTTLSNNGGPTFTHALQSGSNAIDAIGCTSPVPATDQRGVGRPQDGDGGASSTECDIGAYEYPELFDLDVTIAGTGAGNVTGPAFSGGGIDCNTGNTPDCSEAFASGTTVALTASPSVGSTFAGWSGDCDSDGEVVMTEDRGCTATFNGTAGTVIIEKLTNPPDDLSDFLFTNDIDNAPFLLAHGQTKVFADVRAGGYSVSEADPSPEHILLSIMCDDDNSGSSLLSARIILDPGETVTCTFNNARKIEIPTAASLSFFGADTAPTGRVNVTWETGSEADVLGFNLYRSTSLDGTFARVNRSLIPNQGSAVQGARYRLSDMPGVGGFYYKLEVINVDKGPQMFGPVAARVDALRVFLPGLVKR